MLLRDHEQVAFLDLDLGQAEFTPPGFVSLHTVSSPILSPPHRHIAHPQHSYYVGDNTAQHDPTRYIQAAKATYQHYLDSPAMAKIPLVVNTAGWLTGLGAELTLELVASIQPSSIIRIVRPTDSYAAAAEAEDGQLEASLEARGRKVYTLVSATKGKISSGVKVLAQNPNPNPNPDPKPKPNPNSGQSAAQKRELQCLNYFDAALPKAFGPFDVSSHGGSVAKGYLDDAPPTSSPNLFVVLSGLQG